jgi:hypothetical protein
VRIWRCVALEWISTICDGGSLCTTPEERAAYAVVAIGSGAISSGPPASAICTRASERGRAPSCEVGMPLNAHRRIGRGRAHRRRSSRSVGSAVAAVHWSCGRPTARAERKRMTCASGGRAAARRCRSSATGGMLAPGCSRWAQPEPSAIAPNALRARKSTRALMTTTMAAEVFLKLAVDPSRPLAGCPWAAKGSLTQSDSGSVSRLSPLTDCVCDCRLSL